MSTLTGNPPSSGGGGCQRVIEAIADAVKADPGSDEDIAQDYGVPAEAVTACAQWARDHPDGHERALDHGFLGPA